MYSELFKLSDKDVENIIKPPIHDNSIINRLIDDFNLSKHRQKPRKKQKKQFKRLKQSKRKQQKQHKRQKQPKQSRTTKRRFKLKK